MSENESTSVGRDCPTCGGELTDASVVETFDFCYDAAGGRHTTAAAVSVPVERCGRCGEELSGPRAARIRQSAVVTALCRHLVELEDALGPFADFARRLDGGEHVGADDRERLETLVGFDRAPTVGDCRAAARALDRLRGGGGKAC